MQPATRVPAVLALAALLAAAARADTITMRDGTRLEAVQITVESLSKIEYKKPKVTAPETVKTSTVQSVEYGKTPTDYQVGVASRDEGDLATAALHFEAASEEKDSPPFVRAMALAEAGEAQLQEGAADAAAKTFSQVIEKFADTRQYPRALLGRGRAALLAGRTEDAKKAFTQLKTEAGTKDLGEHWGLLAELWLLRATELAGTPDKLKEALAGYEALRGRAGDANKDVAALCALRMGRTELALGELDKALPLLEQALAGREKLPREEMASAFNARGRCLAAKAQAASDEANQVTAKGGNAEAARAAADAAWHDALLDFLRVFVSYADVPSQQPEALYWAAQCYQAAPDQDGKGTGASRAAALLKRCRELYPDSSWAKKASQG